MAPDRLELDRSSGAHHPPAWLSAADDVKDEKREFRDVGESRGEVPVTCVGELKKDPPKGDTSDG